MQTGDVVPDFTLPDEQGKPRSLSGLLESGPVVLFFYPAALSVGCTAEACHFRDLGAEFEAEGAVRVGISGDSVSRQQEFTAKHTFDYPLLSDADGEVAKVFGVQRRFGPMDIKRHTFVIDIDRRILAVIKSEVRMSVHADKALQALRNRARAGEHPEPE